MKKKMLSVMLVLGMAFSCWGYNVWAEEADAEAGTSEIAFYGEGEFTEYGLTQEQQDALVESVKTSITEEYLNKYGIAPEEFVVRQYDPNDFNDYDATLTYVGDDPYEWSSFWLTLENILRNSDLVWDLQFLGGVMDDGEAESGISYLDEINLADSLQEETQNGHGNAFIFDTASKQYDLQNAVYKGIANFLKGMECQEAGQVMVNLLRFSKIMYAENVMVNGYEYPSGTMFDRVISENIQF